VVLRRIQVEDLRKLAAAVDRFGDALEDLANADPPAERAATAHPEIRGLTREFDRAALLVETAVKAKFMTADQYRKMAGHFAAIGKLMGGGAAKEAAAEKRRATPGRGKAAPKTRKSPARRR
jgi:hypothetical protein